MRETVETDHEYYRAVEYFARIQSEKSFGNSDEKHALPVFEVLFKNATKKIRIFAHNLCGNVPNDDNYVSELKDFLEKRGGTVEILLEEKPDDESLKEKPIFKMLNSLKSKKCVIKQTAARAKYYDIEINFSTGDDGMYRIEYEKDRIAARYCFNDRKITETLNNFFDRFFITANPIVIPC